MTILYSMSRQDEARRQTDVYFCPPLYKVGLLQWSRFDQIVRQGYDYAAQLIDAMPDSQRTAFDLAPRTSRQEADDAQHG